MVPQRTGSVDRWALRVLARREIGVTSALALQSILEGRALRGVAPLRDGVAGPRKGGETKEEASNILTTGLQQACNFLATIARLRHCSHGTSVLMWLHGRRDRQCRPPNLTLRSGQRSCVYLCAGASVCRRAGLSW